MYLTRQSLVPGYEGRFRVELVVQVYVVSHRTIKSPAVFLFSLLFLFFNV